MALQPLPGRDELMTLSQPLGIELHATFTFAQVSLQVNVPPSSGMV